MEEQTWVTYRLANGDLVQGEYAWIDSPEVFDDIEDTTEVIRETWVLQKSETIIFEPNHWEDEFENNDEIYLEKIQIRKTRSEESY